MNLRPLYRVLSLLGVAKAASKGPEALANNYIRRKSHDTLAGFLNRLLRRLPNRPQVASISQPQTTTAARPPARRS